MAEDPEEAEAKNIDDPAKLRRLAEKKEQPREHVIRAYQRSLARFSELYKKEKTPI